MKRHSDARPHTCPLCAHGFKTPRDLKVSWHCHSDNFAAELVETHRSRAYTVRHSYNETDFILTKIELLSMKQCMPSM